MKIFIDTNILLDFMCQREPFYADAYTIFRKAAMHEYEIAVSALTIVNTQGISKFSCKTSYSKRIPCYKINGPG